MTLHEQNRESSESETVSRAMGDHAGAVAKPFAITYHHKSAHARKGLGTGKGKERRPETLSDEQQAAIAAIDAIPNWRKILSNFRSHTFELDGREYGSTEACFQAAKLRRYEAPQHLLQQLEDPQLLGPDAQRLGQRKSYPLTKEQLQDWQTAHHAAMEACLRASLKTDSLKRKLLKQLHELPAELWHIPGRAKPPTRDLRLEHHAAAIAREAAQPSSGSAGPGASQAAAREHRRSPSRRRRSPRSRSTSRRSLRSRSRGRHSGGVSGDAKDVSKVQQ